MEKLLLTKQKNHKRLLQTIAYQKYRNAKSK